MSNGMEISAGLGLHPHSALYLFYYLIFFFIYLPVFIVLYLPFIYEA